MKFKGGHFAVGAPLAEFKGGTVTRCPPRSAAYDAHMVMHTYSVKLDPRSELHRCILTFL